MSKGNSNLFKHTIGVLKELAEQILTRYMPNGEKNTDFDKLPGSKGIEIPKRLTDEEMTFLTEEYGIEFAQVYKLGPGKNGRGGKYFVYSGTLDEVTVPIDKDIMLINHTHPRGTAYPSKADINLMKYYAISGSPQKTSSIIPVGKNKIKFTRKGLK